MYYDELNHSAKGSSWKDHKYIAIKNGRYIYPGDVSSSRPKSREKNIVSGTSAVFKGEKVNSGGSVARSSGRARLSPSRSNYSNSEEEEKEKVWESYKKARDNKAYNEGRKAARPAAEKYKSDQLRKKQDDAYKSNKNLVKVIDQMRKRGDAVARESRAARQKVEDKKTPVASAIKKVSQTLHTLKTTPKNVVNSGKKAISAAIKNVTKKASPTINKITSLFKKKN